MDRSKNQSKNRSKYRYDRRLRPLREDRGRMTVEASVLIPIVFLLVAGSILLFLTIGKRESLRGELYRSIYTLSLAEENDGDLSASLEERASGISRGYGQRACESLKMGDYMIMRGSVPYINSLSKAGRGVFRTEFPVIVKRERDLCSNRLRRWQFYGDITEE